MGQAAAATRAGSAGAPRYARHRPEQTLLYRIVAQHYRAFVELLAGQGRPLPDYVQQEFEAYLKCGRLEHGFLRVRCESCHAEHLVAFSCKRRGFLPQLRGPAHGRERGAARRRSVSYMSSAPTAHSRSGWGRRRPQAPSSPLWRAASPAAWAAFWNAKACSNAMPRARAFPRSPSDDAADAGAAGAPDRLPHRGRAARRAQGVHAAEPAGRR